MILINGKDFEIKDECAVMLGKFDGVHCGHMSLLRSISEDGNAGLKTLVFTFSVSPKNYVSGLNHDQIMTLNEKRNFFEKQGVDYLVEYPFDDETMSMPAENFIKKCLVGQLHAKSVVVGEDFCFGHKRAGNVDLLEKMSKEYGYTLHTIKKLVDADGNEISSTRIVSLIREGRMEECEAILGKPYEFTGEVTHGAGFGHTVGVPTVNLVLPEEKVIPPYGVYISTVTVGGTTYRAVTNIGVKPTVTDGKTANLEAFILDFSGDLYGNDIEVKLYKHTRPERTFENPEALVSQIQKDVEEARKYLISRGL